MQQTTLLDVEYHSENLAYTFELQEATRGFLTKIRDNPQTLLQETRYCFKCGFHYRQYSKQLYGVSIYWNRLSQF